MGSGASVGGGGGSTGALAVTLSLPDRESVDYLKRVHRAYLGVPEDHARERPVGVEHVKELLDALKEMKVHLVDRCPAF